MASSEADARGIRANAAAWARLAGLSGLAIAQPLLDVLVRSPSFFVNNGAGRAEIVAFVLIVLLGPPTIVLCVGSAAGALFGPRARRGTHLVGVGSVAVLLVAPLLDRFVPVAPVAAVLTVGAAVGFALLYRRFVVVRRFLLIAALGIPVIAAIFLFDPGVTPMLRGGDVEVHGTSLSFRAKPPIVLLVFDEFPLSSLVTTDGRIDAARYPNFAKLSQRATWYRNATTVSDTTSQALPAMFTGKRVRPYTAKVAAVHPRSLYTLLGGVYRFRGRPDPLCPPAACPQAVQRSARPGSSPADRVGTMVGEAAVVIGYIALPSDLEDHLPAAEALGLGISEPNLRRPTGGLTAPVFEHDPRMLRFSADIEKIRPQGARVDLLYGLLPHRPWTLLPSAQTHSPLEWRIPALGPDFRWSRDPAGVRASYVRHLLQVGAVDQLIGRFVERLEETGLFDDALIVVSADHGISFRPGENSRLHPLAETITDIASVPLFVKYPQQRAGRTVDIDAQLIDVLPTVIDVVGADVGWDLDGRSLIGPRPGDPRLLIDSVGKPHQLPTNLVGELLAAARRKFAFTGLVENPRTPAEEFFAYGPHASLVGRPAAELSRGPAVPVRWHVHHGPLGTDVDTRDGVLPAIVSATTTDRSVAAKHVAVAVNGRIGTVAQVFEWDHELWLDAPFLPSLLVDGRNEIELYLVDGDGARVELRPMGSRPPGR